MLMRLKLSGKHHFNLLSSYLLHINFLLFFSPFKLSFDKKTFMIGYKD